ncbi:MAG: NUDIX hydrolase [Nakamurella sp.]
MESGAASGLASGAVPDGGPGAVPIRSASTVMLLRDGSSGPEVFTLQRVSQMAFAAGMTVFPGGGVDDSDADRDVPWTGPDAGWWADRWGIAADAARSHVVAAVRELYEETGVLLAGPDVTVGSSTVGALEMMTGALDLSADRAAVAAHRTSLAMMLRATGAQLRSDLLRPWARWITPPGPSRRYDTYFFLAALPEGQSADHATTEAVGGGWNRPAEVLRAGESGEIGLMPPTVAMLTDLAAASSVDELLAAPRVVQPVMPTVLSSDGEVLRVRVGDREFHTRLRRG